jgi:hypothetical protein
MTMSIVLVASLAASMAEAVTATITSTGIRTSSRASPGSRSVLPSAYRRSERRTFLGVIAGGLLAAPLAAEALQAGKVYRLGLLGPGG